ncbi:hypothetical protein AB0J47_22760 [Nocardia sp. NPDC049737]|uniref:hypothetical protein n=1 Tax=Nocardia sp. NPDC049737 TaxID=3154358 RepID=UPI003443FA4D
MGTFKADLEQLGKLGTTLHNLAREAEGAKPKRTAEVGSPEQLQSVGAGLLLESEQLLGVLIPTLKERLSETGDVMANVAQQFKDADESNAGNIMDLYRKSTGDWTA